MVRSHITRPKIKKTESGLQYTQHGLVSIIIVQFDDISINGFREIGFAINVYGPTDQPTDKRDSYIVLFTTICLSYYFGIIG